jgi:hypothetical protein
VRASPPPLRAALRRRAINSLTKFRNLPCPRLLERDIVSINASEECALVAFRIG